MTVSLDSQGRVKIPLSLRRALSSNGESTLVVIPRADGFLLRPKRTAKKTPATQAPNPSKPQRT